MEKKDKCEHCGWEGKHILLHMRHARLCMEKTDMNQLRQEVEQQKQSKKRKYDKDHYKKQKQKKKQYYETHREDKVSYQKVYDETHREEKVS